MHSIPNWNIIPTERTAEQHARSRRERMAEKHNETFTHKDDLQVRIAIVKWLEANPSYEIHHTYWRHDRGQPWVVTVIYIIVTDESLLKPQDI